MAATRVNRRTINITKRNKARSIQNSNERLLLIGQWNFHEKQKAHEKIYERPAEGWVWQGKRQSKPSYLCVMSCDTDVKWQTMLSIDTSDCMLASSFAEVLLLYKLNRSSSCSSGLDTTRSRRCWHFRGGRQLLDKFNYRLPSNSNKSREETWPAYSWSTENSHDMVNAYSQCAQFIL